MSNLPVRCYDNKGVTLDRYTVVYTEPYTVDGITVYNYVGMSDNPMHPQGIGQHGETVALPADVPENAHLGTLIPFDELPEPCQRLVLADLEVEV